MLAVLWRESRVGYSYDGMSLGELISGGASTYTVKRRAKDRDLNRDHLATPPRLRIGEFAVVLFDKLKGGPDHLADAAIF